MTWLTALSAVAGSSNGSGKSGEDVMASPNNLDSSSGGINKSGFTGKEIALVGGVVMVGAVLLTKIVSGRK